MRTNVLLGNDHLSAPATLLAQHHADAYAYAGPVHRPQPGPL
jgi:hypothetical protein